jgi:hypothetical protein
VSLLVVAILVGLGLGLTGLSGLAQPVASTGRPDDGRASRGSLRPAVPLTSAPLHGAPGQPAAPTTAAPATAAATTRAASPTAAARTPTAAPSPATTPSPTPASSPTGVRTIAAYLTGYSYFDNTPPGSVEISHAVLHQSAGGTGTYADPITVAVGHSIVEGRDVLDWPAGTRFYVPNLRRYFVVEDTCGDGSTPQSGPCHVGYPAPATTWLDLWVGGSGGPASGADSCMDSVTGVWTVLVDPAPNYATVVGDIYGSAGCTGQYGNAVVTS